MAPDNNIAVKTIGIYPLEQSIITRVANQMFEGNESQAVRYIIRQWDNLAWQHPQQQKARVVKGKHGPELVIDDDAVKSS